MRASGKSAREALGLLPYDAIDHLRTPEDRAGYLDVWFEDYPEDSTGISKAIWDIVRAHGVADIARKCDLSPEGLQHSLSEVADPSLSTTLKVLNAMGIRLKVELLSAQASVETDGDSSERPD